MPYDCDDAYLQFDSLRSDLLHLFQRDAHHYAERLNAWLHAQPEGAFQIGSVVDWAMESHDIARDHVYVLPDDRKLGEGMTLWETTS